VAPLVPKIAAKLGGRQVVGLGFLVTAIGFGLVGLVDPSWQYRAFVLPLIAIAVGMGLSNNPASAAATASVSAEQVGAASGVSNMARYVGAAVATALAATIYSSITANHVSDGASQSDALAAGLSSTAWVMALISFVGVLMAVVMGRRARATQATLADAAAAASAHTHTLPTTASAHAGS
jgi:MFS family permease